MNRWKENLGPEGRLLVDVVGNLRKLGWVVWNMEQNRRTRVTAGVPDLMVAHQDTFCAIELKAGSGKPTRHQLTFLRAFRRAGNDAFVAWSWGEVAWGLTFLAGSDALPEEIVPDVGDLSDQFLRFATHLYEPGCLEEAP